MDRQIDGKRERRTYIQREIEAAIHLFFELKMTITQVQTRYLGL